jgi:hypothetical protein
MNATQVQEASARLPLQKENLYREDAANHILWRAVKCPETPYSDWAVKDVDRD